MLSAMHVKMYFNCRVKMYVTIFLKDLSHCLQENCNLLQVGGQKKVFFLEKQDDVAASAQSGHSRRLINIIVWAMVEEGV